MIYTEYKTAALRHLKTCKFILQKIKQDNLPVPTQRQYYYNAYYLAGHSIEAVVTYAIYDYIGYPENENVKDLNNSHALAQAYDVVFRGNKRFKIIHHNFQENINFFHYHNINNLQSIPFIGYRLDSTLQNMFDNWDPEIRYTTLLDIDTQHKTKRIDLQPIPSEFFEKFVIATEKKYTGINSLITKS